MRSTATSCRSNTTGAGPRRRVVISEGLYRDVATDYAGPEARTVGLRGKAEPFGIRVLKVG